MLIIKFSSDDCGWDGMEYRGFVLLTIVKSAGMYYISRIIFIRYDGGRRILISS